MSSETAPAFSDLLYCSIMPLSIAPTLYDMTDDDYRQVHAHTHFRRPVVPHKVITSLHQRPVKQALHHTNI